MIGQARFPLAEEMESIRQKTRAAGSPWRVTDIVGIGAFVVAACYAVPWALRQIKEGVSPA